MASLKDMRVRISSVRATRKITSAMKLVSASKLRRAQEQAEAARPYAERMARMLANLAGGLADMPGAPKLLAGTGETTNHLILVATADRGLCGGFNSSIVRATRRRILDLRASGHKVKLVCIGRKGRDMLRREFANDIVESFDGIVGKRRLDFVDSQRIAEAMIRLFDEGQFDVAEIVYNKFKSAMVQTVTFKQIVPVETVATDAAPSTESQSVAPYEFEPDEERILSELLPRNLAVQIFNALLENAASEQGARMVAMENATRNAGEMINKLTLSYNRQRQANITRELIEIVSGAEAV